MPECLVQDQEGWQQVLGVVPAHQPNSTTRAANMWAHWFELKPEVWVLKSVMSSFEETSIEI